MNGVRPRVSSFPGWRANFLFQGDQNFAQGGLNWKSCHPRLGQKGFAEALASGLEASNIEAAGKRPHGQKLSERLANGQKCMERFPNGTKIGEGATKA